MREMVLNHASLLEFTQAEITPQLKDTAVGMAVLVARNVTVPMLRTCKPVQEVYCNINCSLYDGYLSLNNSESAEHYAFLMRLTTKTPVLIDVSDDIEDRLIACESIKLQQEDGLPLLLCALTDWVAVGFPKEPWDHDQVEIRF